MIKASGDISKFVKLLIDNKELEKKYYTVKKGSTIVNISADYLKTLSVGEHVLTFVYTDGEVSTNFSLFANKVETPATGDDDVYYFIPLFLSFIFMMAILFIRKKGLI